MAVLSNCLISNSAYLKPNLKRDPAFPMASSSDHFTILKTSMLARPIILSNLRSSLRLPVSRIKSSQARAVSTTTNLRPSFPQLSPPPFSIPYTRNMSIAAMSKRLSGKTIVITGASSGIGRSCAMEFAKTSPDDLKLILTARRADVLKEVAEEINKEVGKGVKVLPVQLDVSNPDDIRQFVGKLPEEFKDIDVLVNNA